MADGTSANIGLYEKIKRLTKDANFNKIYERIQTEYDSFNDSFNGTANAGVTNGMKIAEKMVNGRIASLFKKLPNCSFEYKSIEKGVQNFLTGFNYLIGIARDIEHEVEFGCTIAEYDSKKHNAPIKDYSKRLTQVNRRAYDNNRVLYTVRNVFLEKIAKQTRSIAKS